MDTQFEDVEYNESNRNVVPKKDAKDLIYGTCHKCRGPSQNEYKEEADK